MDFPNTKPEQPAKRAKVSDSMMAVAEPTQPEGERIQSATFRFSVKPRACSARLFGCVVVPAPSIRRGPAKSGNEHISGVALLANRQACLHRFMAIIRFLSPRSAAPTKRPQACVTDIALTLGILTAEMEEIA